MTQSTAPQHPDWTWDTLNEATLPLLAEAYYSEWGHETPGDEVLARQVARYYTAHLANQANFSRLWLAEGKIAGVILGRLLDRPVAMSTLPADFQEEKLAAALEVHPNPAGRKSITFLKMLSTLNAEIYQRAIAAGREFDAELLFLFVAKPWRQVGLAKEMIAWAQETMRAAGAKNYYLFTDSHCNWHYYTRAPWQQEGECPWLDLYDFAGGRELMFSRTL